MIFIILSIRKLCPRYPYIFCSAKCNYQKSCSNTNLFPHANINIKACSLPKESTTSWREFWNCCEYLPLKETWRTLQKSRYFFSSMLRVTRSNLLNTVRYKLTKISKMLYAYKVPVPTRIL